MWQMGLLGGVGVGLASFFNGLTLSWSWATLFIIVPVVLFLVFLLISRFGRFKPIESANPPSKQSH
jgi:choline-glycine betaine transporter